MVSHAKYVGVLGAVIPAQPDHRHSRAGGNPGVPGRWIPAFAGMTKGNSGMTGWSGDDDGAHLGLGLERSQTSGVSKTPEVSSRRVSRKRGVPTRDCNPKTPRV